MRPWTLLCVVLMAGVAEPAELYLVRDGAPAATIVVDQGAGDFYGSLAGELRTYVEKITGVRLLISDHADGASIRIHASRSYGLPPDGFLLRGDARSLTVAGGDEASTMYAVYDLIERLGVTFLLTGDILPERTATLKLPALDVRVETPFPRRGLLISNIYPNRGIWNLSEVKAFLDQMAKLKMNYLQFFWFEHEPWINFSYRGEGKLLGDATGKETGYLTWRYNYGSNLVKDLAVGRNLFQGRARMAPAEFQKVETPEQGFAVAKDFLNEIIRYARRRKIKVWPCIDPTTLQGNHARLARRARNLQLPFHPILGTHMCPGDPVLYEINESRLKALVDTYPEAEGYILYIPEMYPNCPDEQDRALLASLRPKFEGLLKLWQPYTQYERKRDVVLDSNIGSLHIVQKVLEARDRVAPRARLAIGGIGRGYVLPFMDKLFARSVPFTDMESRAIWTPAGVPMQYFGGMGERERTLVPRMDDDSAMFGNQFSVNLYFKDRMLEGSLENGVAGFAGQINRVRGQEQNYLYLARGAWRPHLTPKEFYAEHAERIFGGRARDEMVAAFQVLEQNEEYLSWTGAGNFGCCGVIPEVSRAYGYYKQPNPFDGPTGWSGFNQDSLRRIELFSHAAELLDQALAHLNRATAEVAPHGRGELAYLKNKTESYAMMLRTLVTARRAYLAFEDAFRLRTGGGEEEFRRRLDAAMEMFRDARRMGRRTTERFAGLIDHPSDLGTLYRANLFLVTGLELTEQTMENVWNFHHGREYTRRVAWDKIYYGYPAFAPAY